MICDTIDNFEKYNNLFPNKIEIEQILKKIKTNKLVDSYKIFEYILLPSDECTFENHKKNIDIHVIMEGSEKFYFANVNECDAICIYNEDEDYQLFESKIYTQIEVKAGSFIVFFPGEAHSPRHYVNNHVIKRAVIKCLQSNHE